jgi:hypothetical protein
MGLSCHLLHVVSSLTLAELRYAQVLSDLIKLGAVLRGKRKERVCGVCER